MTGQSRVSCQFSCTMQERDKKRTSLVE